jgi:tetratricopeptide (TPR) repeat protein
VAVETAFPQFALVYSGFNKEQKGNRAGAISDYTEAIRQYPECELAHLERGIAKANSGDFPGAISDLTDAINLEPGPPWQPESAYTFLNRGLAKTGLGNTAGASADYAEALRLCDEALNLNVNIYLARVNRAMAREITGDKSGAVEDMAKAIQFQDEGQLEFASFRLNARAWKEMLDKPPLPAEVIRLRALAEDAFKNKEYDKAADYYEKGLAVEPVWWQGQFNAAMLDGDLQLYAKAAAHMRRFLELNPDSNAAKMGRSKLLVWEKKAGEAEPDLANWRQMNFQHCVPYGFAPLTNDQVPAILP